MIYLLGCGHLADACCSGSQGYNYCVAYGHANCCSGDNCCSTCANCGVARYCNHSHQKIAWKRPWAEGPPHKLICPLLKKFKLEGKRKHVVSNEELLEFLDELRTKCSLAHGGNGGGGVYGEVHELGA